MMNALFTAASGMSAQQMNLDVIANNLANVSTTGFKESRVNFENLLSQMIRTPGAQVASGIQEPSGISEGLGVRPGSTERIFTQGTLTQTNNPLDLAIQGNGFFQITLPDGTTAYTRAGSFQVDSTGRLVTADGFPVSPQITIPQNAISLSVGEDGTVSALLQGQTTPTVVGQITLANFINPAGLMNDGQNLYLQTAASGPPIIGTAGINGLGSLQQGYLENSNVDAVNQLINVILAQQAFEYNSRVITSSNNMLSTVEQMVT
ncbi:MAG: flagellar basal-body rod protein FlgG [Firmicutes bacterium]|nr:flagellar basal-body rod protein FlgG [Bacillota bacterium]